MSLDRELDELLRKLNTKKEKIDEIQEGKEKEREKKIYLERINYLKKYFPSAYNSCAYSLTRNLDAKREEDHKVVKSDKQTIFPGLNLRSSYCCAENYLHNYPLGEGIFILDDYYKKKYTCKIEGCGTEFCFDKYFTFWKCYYSVNNEPEKSTGADDNVVKFSIVPGEKKEIKVRLQEKFNVIIKGEKLFDFYFPIESTVREFKNYIEGKIGNEIILKEVYFFRFYEKKKLEHFDTLECISRKEIDVELVKDESTFDNFGLEEKIKIIVSLNN